MVKATFQLYAEAARDAGRAVLRSPLAAVGLVLANLGLMGLMLLIGATVGNNLITGFILGFAQAAAIGWYLSLVAIAVEGKRRVRFSDLAATFGQGMWDVISVLFVFWIASMLLGPLGPMVTLAATAAATVAFNPAPEMLYQERSRSLELLGDAARFMQNNWPEWLGAHVLIGLLAAGLLYLAQGHVGASEVISILQLFGPFFAFVTVGAMFLGQLTDPMGLAAGVGLLALVQFTMCFRGALYARLRRSSRRSRAWQSRMDRP